MSVRAYFKFYFPLKSHGLVIPNETTPGKLAALVGEACWFNMPNSLVRVSRSSNSIFSI